MFEFVRTHTRILQFVLVLLIFPSFVFLGVQGYSNFTEGANASVAKVDGHAITQGEWDQAHNNRAEMERRQRPDIDPKQLDAPEVKWQTLEALVRERVMLAAVHKYNLLPTNERLKRLFQEDPQMAMLRNPDGSVNKELLAMQGMSSEQFAERLRQDYAMRQVMAGITSSVIAPVAATDTALDALFQQREVQALRFSTDDYIAKVHPTDADLEAYYKNPANAAQFQAPEQASIEYVVLDMETVKKSITVPEEELKNYYEQNKNTRYTVPEERRASHILVKAPKDAPEAERAKAKAKAEALLAEVKKNPQSFAEVARKNSDDPGSAQRGGDLDFFGRGAMVKPFEDAAFALKPGEISNIVESDFGYHIIKLAEVRGGQVKPFEQVRAQIEDEVKAQLAKNKFAESADQFNNLVYEQSDSLKPTADKLKLEIRTATVKRTPAPDATGPLASPKFLDAIFGTDAVRDKRNTDAVEVEPGVLVSGRIVQHQPAHMLPLAEVKDRVRQRVTVQQAAALARKEGQEKLAQLKQGGTGAASLPAPVKVSRLKSEGLARAAIDAILRADASKLPTLIGVNLADAGYVVVRINAVLPRDTTAVPAESARQEYAQLWGAAEAAAYYAALKARTKAEFKATAPTSTAATATAEAR